MQCRKGRPRPRSLAQEDGSNPDDYAKFPPMHHQSATERAQDERVCARQSPFPQRLVHANLPESSAEGGGSAGGRRDKSNSNLAEAPDALSVRPITSGAVQRRNTKDVRPRATKAPFSAANHMPGFSGRSGTRSPHLQCSREASETVHPTRSSTTHHGGSNRLQKTDMRRRIPEG